MTNPLIQSLTRAVQAAPEDVPLRLHLAELLVADGQQDAAITHCAVALQHEPGSAAARSLMGRAMASPVAPPVRDATPPAPPPVAPTTSLPLPSDPPALGSPTPG
ncbi:MAG: tetratricopeptide repeat protein, partial [Lapillicoccus sp.]